jgi:CheY-specific phosphatase CheX
VIFVVADTIGAVFTDALAEIIRTVSGFTLEIKETEADSKFYGMTGMMSLNSKNQGMLFISAGEASMRVLCSFMTGVPANEVTAGDMQDALCELVNMTAGNVKIRISEEDYMFTLVPPFIISGEKMELVTKRRVRVISSTLSDSPDNILIRLKIVY